MSQPAIHPDPLISWREKFPTVENSTYLVSHSLGAMPLAAREGLLEYADAWQELGVEAWSDRWWDMPASVGDLVAGLIAAPAGSVSMHLNVTLAQSILLSAIDWSGKRNRLVCTDLDFTSLLYLYEGLRAQGAEIVRVPSDDGMTIDGQRIADAIDERTAVAAFSHVIFRSGALVDVEPVVARAREVGAFTLLDAYQAVGTVPVDVTQLGIDVLTGGSVKWLCGGPGAGYLYVRPESAALLRPRITGWMAHSDPFAFDAGPMEPVTGRFRYLNGTPGIPSLYAAQAGYNVLRQIGAPTIRRHSLQLTQRILEAAAERGWKVHTPSEPQRRGGTVCFEVANAPRVCAELSRRKVIVDHRPGVGIRIGPHFYNTIEDVDHALEEIDKVVRDIS